MPSPVKNCPWLTCICNITGQVQTLNHKMKPREKKHFAAKAGKLPLHAELARMPTLTKSSIERQLLVKLFPSPIFLAHLETQPCPHLQRPQGSFSFFLLFAFPTKAKQNPLQILFRRLRTKLHAGSDPSLRYWWGLADGLAYDLSTKLGPVASRCAGTLRGRAKQGQQGHAHTDWVLG
ncbi:hypothetical protein IF2G_06773 [Cordyceps javanica]|nr:hypothetical protein IF2G_06773 [Cordyceps javanica]